MAAWLTTEELAVALERLIGPPRPRRIVNGALEPSHDNDWWEGPWPFDERRKCRRSFEELLIEHAERTGQPVIKLTRVFPNHAAQERRR